MQTVKTRIRLSCHVAAQMVSETEFTMIILNLLPVDFICLKIHHQLDILTSD